MITALRNCVENYKKETNPTIINIGCSENISIGEAYNKLATLLNYKKMPHYKEVLYPEPAYTRADNKKAAECLGWTPSIFFEEGLEKTVSSFKRKQKIVIGMPLHNGASTIRRAVNSFLNQKDIKRDICLVIINDSSTDNWQSEIEDLLCDSIIIENVNFRSVFSTRNYINRYILQHFPQACMIGRLDADDEFAHEKVLHEVEKIIDSENPDIILAGNLLRCNDEILERKNCPTSEMTEKNVLLQRLKLMSEGISHAELPSCNTLIKPQYILEYPERTSAEDHWLTVEYILNKDKYHIHVAENLIYAIYSLSGNLTAQNRKEDEYFKSRRELYDYAYSKVNGDVGQEN